MRKATAFHLTINIIYHYYYYGNSADKPRHTRFAAHSGELVLLNKQQISGGGACLHCYHNYHIIIIMLAIVVYCSSDCVPFSSGSFISDLLYFRRTMSSYFRPRNGPTYPQPHAPSGCTQPPLLCGLQYAVRLPASGSCRSQNSLSDICAAIRHHILDQVTCSAPLGGRVLTTSMQTGRADMRPPNRPQSAPTYGVRGTK